MRLDDSSDRLRRAVLRRRLEPRQQSGVHLMPDHAVQYGPRIVLRRFPRYVSNEARL
jgi:hypothetical protein